VLSKKIQDHYETLGITKNATQADIKKAFLSRSKQLHPDVNQADPQKHEKFVELNAAFQTLNKVSSRREYDMTQRHYDSVTQHTYPGAAHRPGPSSMGHDEWHDWNRPYQNIQGPYREYTHVFGWKISNKNPIRQTLITCAVLVASGFVLFFSAHQYYQHIVIPKLRASDQANRVLLTNLRKAAEENTFEKNVELLREEYKRRDALLKAKNPKNDS